MCTSGGALILSSTGAHSYKNIKHPSILRYLKDYHRYKDRINCPIKWINGLTYTLPRGLHVCVNSFHPPTTHVRLCEESTCTHSFTSPTHYNFINVQQEYHSYMHTCIRTISICEGQVFSV